MRMWKYANFGKGALIEADDIRATISDERLQPTVYENPREHLVQGFQHVTLRLNLICG